MDSTAFIERPYSIGAGFVTEGHFAGAYLESGYLRRLRPHARSA